MDQAFRALSAIFIIIIIIIIIYYWCNCFTKMLYGIKTTCTACETVFWPDEK